MDRAYSLLEVKSVDEGRRIFRGWATTPAPDRMSDTIDPLGASFKNPLVLLHQHRHDAPIGAVRLSKPTAKGIEFEAEVPVIDEPGPLKDRVDTAWGEIKHGLVKAVSIGFRPIKYAYKDDGGIEFQEIEILELSSVSVPANASAVITAVKSLEGPVTREIVNEIRRFDIPSIDTQQRAATGTSPPRVDPPPGVSGTQKQPASSRFFFAPNKGKEMKTIAEQIAALESARTAKTARMSEIMQKSMDEGRSTDDTEREEFDNLDAEVKTADGDLARLRQLEKLNVAKAVPVSGVKDGETASQSRGGATILSVKSNLPKGTAFTRYAMALAAGRGSLSDALRHVEGKKHWMDQTPEVAQYIKATAGTTTDADWAAPLVAENNLAAEFIDLLRPATVIGRIEGIRRVPFNVKIAVQTGGSTVNWVGEAAPKPVSDLAFDAITLGHDKVAGIVVLTDELVRFSSPSAEDTVRRDLVAQISGFLDKQFLDPAVTASANNPASVTNGVTATVASGTDADSLYYDLQQALAGFINSDMGLDTGYWVMRPGTALGISMLRNALGQLEFTGVGRGGGTLMNIPVIVSNNAPAGMIVFLTASEILIADDGNVTLDASREATLDMNGGTTPNFSLFQRNAVAIRAERWVTWRKRHPNAVSVITGAAYGPAAPVTPEE